MSEKKTHEEMVEFVEKMKKENPKAFNFLAAGATRLLESIEQDKQEAIKEDEQE